MKIFDRRELNANMKPICNLNPGTVFEYDDYFYMKGTDAKDTNHCRAVNLDTGEFLYLETFVQVFPLFKAHLEIPKDEIIV